MKVKDLEQLLSAFDDEQEVVLLDEAPRSRGRMGHAVLAPTVQMGFINRKNDEDVQLEEDDDHSVPCCVISIWK